MASPASNGPAVLAKPEIISGMDMRQVPTDCATTDGLGVLRPGATDKDAGQVAP